MVRITHDHEKVQFNLARLKKEGEIFEIVVEPSLAIQFKERNDGDISEILKSEKIFSDAKKGLLASEHKLKEIFIRFKIWCTPYRKRLSANYKYGIVIHAIGKVFKHINIFSKYIFLVKINQLITTVWTEKNGTKKMTYKINHYVIIILIINCMDN